ncbi:hypothetical protein [Glutamicibacter sp. ZJUTW]|uniref:hypothetical protein n=1 Tax=Glutamicibacter sp. ZJUTW TaxID=1155384 RepID=UPI001AEF3B92|nr:hypothetical protein [Glutamicibacter sp. ZJUTW]
MKDEKLFSLEEAAGTLGVDTKQLRSYLRQHRPKGAIQKPPQPGGTWHVSATLLAQLQFAGAPGMDIVLKPVDDQVIDSLEWSPWESFEATADSAPVAPGVYMFRRAGAGDHKPIYVGQAGERSGKGLRGRLKIYSSGKGATSGLGKYAFDEALADPQWLRELAAEADRGESRTVQQVARLAIDRLHLEGRWVTCIHRKAALLLEAALIRKYHATLWNVAGAPKDAGN